ncbi:hypothetical protein [Sphingomonas prati]|uniref:Uncharacterized protein n=1 Tax=Sphingomonas prati TaxID=1843237 RepID=A0A7W9F301_9SPHN|nr:hypothetical protein [Sphingomonas prati]MBB5730968.1 hypothetical protein [Sphingomonas prati]
MGDGAGAIEASLLDSDAMLRAGAAIRQIAESVRTMNGNRAVLVLVKDDTVDFSMTLWVVQRMQALKTRAYALPEAGCRKAPIVVEQTTTSGLGRLFAGEASSSDTKRFGLARTDIVAALASDVSVGAIKLSAEDRRLVNAILMGGAKQPKWVNLASPRAAPEKASNDWLIILNDRLAIDPATNRTFVLLTDLQSWTDANRQCDSDGHKAMIDTIDKFVAGITSAEKGTPAIVSAAQLAANGFDQVPLILRVAIDDRGGTSITRSNIWYTVGLPGAAVITSGLKVSFQISDPKVGHNLVTGEIRCVTRPTSYRDVRNMLVTQEASRNNSVGKRQAKLVTCAYRAS